MKNLFESLIIVKGEGELLIKDKNTVICRLPMTTTRTRETSVRIAHLLMNLDRLMEGLDAAMSSKYVPDYVKEKLRLIKDNEEL